MESHVYKSLNEFGVSEAVVNVLETEELVDMVSLKRIGEKELLLLYKKYEFSMAQYCTLKSFLFDDMTPGLPGKKRLTTYLPSQATSSVDESSDTTDSSCRSVGIYKGKLSTAQTMSTIINHKLY